MRGEAGGGEARLGTTRQSSARHGENTASSTVAKSRETVSRLQFLQSVNTPQYIYILIHIYVYVGVNLNIDHFATCPNKLQCDLKFC
jgi:hypothetical protein